jgi:hypothetical protein
MIHSLEYTEYFLVEGRCKKQILGHYDNEPINFCGIIALYPNTLRLSRTLQAASDPASGNYEFSVLIKIIVAV